MGEILRTDLVGDATKLRGLARSAFYNGMDVLLLPELHRKLNKVTDDVAAATYAFERSLQGPVLELMLHGTWIDQVQRKRMILLLERQVRHLETVLNTYGQRTWGRDLNAGSPKQKAAYFYDFLEIEPVRKFDPTSGKMKVTTDRAALEKVRDNSLVAKPVALAVLAFQDVKKALGTLRSGIDPDGYFRAGYNIAGTKTGRLASKKSAFGRASNDQNWAEGLRSIFSAPPGPMPDRDKFNIPEQYQALPYPTHLQKLEKP